MDSFSQRTTAPLCPSQQQRRCSRSQPIPPLLPCTDTDITTQHPQAAYSSQGLSPDPLSQTSPARLSVPSPQSLSTSQQNTFAEVSEPRLSSTSTFNSIRSILTTLTIRMLAGIAALSTSHTPVSIPKSSLPQTLSIPIRATPQATYPTHMLAISASKASSSNEHAIMFPVHDIVLVAQCTALPRLPASSAPSSSAIQVPVLPLALPSPAAFKIIHTYLYTHSLQGVLKALFPLPSAFINQLSHNTVQSTLASGSSLHQLSTYLVSSAGGSLQVLTAHAGHVKELWQDMVALGLNDPELWDTVDLAWEVTLGALNLAVASH